MWAFLCERTQDICIHRTSFVIILILFYPPPQVSLLTSWSPEQHEPAPPWRNILRELCPMSPLMVCIRYRVPPIEVHGLFCGFDGTTPFSDWERCFVKLSKSEKKCFDLAIGDMAFPRCYGEFMYKGGRRISCKSWELVKPQHRAPLFLIPLRMIRFDSANAVNLACFTKEATRAMHAFLSQHATAIPTVGMRRMSICLYVCIIIGVPKPGLFILPRAHIKA